MNEIQDAPTTKLHIFITHDHPDTDAWACLWFGRTFIAKGAEYTIRTLRAGERMEEDVYGEGCEVFYMDTGGGPFDQHGRELRDCSSFKLLAEHYGYADNPGIKPILEMTVAADNVHRMDWTSTHYVLSGLARYYRQGDKSVDWESARDLAFAVLDILYGQACSRAEARKEYGRFSKAHFLPNGLKLVDIGFEPGLRNAAYEDGADVVIWMVPKGKSGRFYPAIQVGRDCKVQLYRVVAELRLMEAQSRGFYRPKGNLGEIGKFDERVAEFGEWFLHDSGRLILCGSRSAELLEETAFTKLSPRDIVKIVKRVLGGLTLAAD